MNTPLPTDSADSYKLLVDTLAKLTGASNSLAKLTGAIKERYNRSITAYVEDFASLQLIIDDAEDVARKLAEANPQWFATAKTITTPYGTVLSRSSTKLEVTNEQVSIELLQQLGPDAAPFLRTVTTLNLEALESLSETELARIRVTRVTSETITVAPAKVTLGKAAMTAAKKATAAAAKV